MKQTGKGLFTSREQRNSQPFAKRLLWLVLALTLPALTIAAAGLYSAYDAEKGATEEILLKTARTLALHLDHDLRALEASLLSVAGRPLPAARQYEAIRQRINEQSQLEGVLIAVGGVDGSHLFSESSNITALATSTERARALQTAADSGKPVLSIHPGPIGNERVVIFDAPFPSGEEEPHILSAEISSAMLARFIAGAGDWQTAAAGPTGHLLVRSRDSTVFDGPLPPPALRAHMAGHSEGVLNFRPEGNTSMTAVFSRSPAYGWHTLIAYPQHRLEAAFKRSVAWLGALALVGVLGLLYVIYLSRQLLRPVARLATATQRLARGDIIPAERTGVTEFDDVQRALRDASQQLARRNSERDQVEAMLRASEQQLRLAMEASELGAWSYDPDTDELTGSERSLVLMGLSGGRLDLERLASVLQAATREQHHAAIMAGIKGREPFIVEICVQWPDDSIHWLEVRGRPVMRASGRPRVVGLVHEITERRTAADRQRMLLRELNHRVKNSLATVQSIALLTRRSTAAEHAWEAFEDRLVGLAKTHDLLTASEWRGAWLDEALASELRPYQNAAGTRIVAEGPRLRLRPRATLTLCMCFHELATNAAKYGALSTDAGRIHVSWSLSAAADGGSGALALQWTESSGPAVVEPTRQGLGSRLLDRGLRRELGGVVIMNFVSSGLSCGIELPLDAIRATPDERSMPGIMDD